MLFLLSLPGLDLAAEPLPSAPDVVRGNEAFEQSSTKSPFDCTLEGFGRIATRGSYSSSTAPKLDGYVLVTKQAFGGLVAIDYRCNSPQNKGVFRVHLHLLENSWVVKKISRLPVK